MTARLIPPMSPLTTPWWDAARRGELHLQRCTRCAAWQFPPRAHCAPCGGRDVAWTAVSGRGSVYSFTVAHRPPHPVFAGQDPLVVAIIELAEGPRLVSNVVGCDPAAVHVDMPVQVAFEPIDDSDVALPVFRPLGADPA